VSPQDFSTVPFAAPAPNGTQHNLFRTDWRAPAAPRERYWLHLLLFALTLVTTTVVGATMQRAFDRNIPFLIEHSFEGFAHMWTNPLSLLVGLPFALTLLAILLAHEFGHYFACLYYRVDASLPYFLPAPTLTGTFGAFIRIRSAIFSKRALFDIGIAGPIAGFLFIIPALAVGIAFSKVIPGVATQGSVTFGTPALLWLAQQAVFPGVPSSDIYLHPVARAAWIGILATALNLLPVGQLDGGHILYSLVGEKHRLLSRLFILLLIPLGIFYWWVWLFWAAVLFFLGMRHPVIYDPSPVGPGRLRLGLLALAIFALCFTFAPVVANDGL
jgi:membrane-associated protease RseP (regulator of RpoE activity)